MARREREAETLDADLEALRELSREELKQRWHRLYGSACPAHMSRIFLLRALAYHVQDKPWEGSTGRRAAASPGPPRASPPAGSAPAVAPKIKPGTRLLREWQGVVLR